MFLKIPVNRDFSCLWKNLIYTAFIFLLIMLFFGILCLILGVAILFNPALLGFLVGFFLFILGSWIILGWYKVNKVLEKTYSVGKYNIVFQKKSGSKK